MRNLSIALFIFLLGKVAFAQSITSNSPYSSFGLGEYGGLDHAVFSGIGNSNITLQDSMVLNFNNPSSYNTLAKGQPLFSLGLSSRLSNYSENGVKDFGSITGIQHFALAFPFAKNFGIAFGLKPYSRRGYEFSSRVKIDDDSIYYSYGGSGSINEAFMGFSANVLNFKGARLSLGGNAGFLFGAVTNTRKAGIIESGITDNGYSGGVSTKSLRAKSFHYEVGLSYEQRINEKHLLGLYAVIDPHQKINGSYEDGLFYTGNINFGNGYDTLSYNDTLTGNVTNIPTYTVGLKYTLSGKGRKGQTNELNSEVSFHLTYSMSDWSKYEDNFDPHFTNTFLNTQKYTFGVQYTPETDFINKRVSTKFFHRVRYRVGTYYFTLPYETNGQQVTDFGTTFGFGFPIAIQKTLSSINLGFSVGNRGTSDSQDLKEQYYGINIGVSIAPGTDRWFRKRKLN
jgi:hypothetical protein